MYVRQVILINITVHLCNYVDYLLIYCGIRLYDHLLYIENTLNKWIQPQIGLIIIIHLKNREAKALIPMWQRQAGGA